MRIAIAGLLVAAPLLTGTPVHADVLDQAQRLLGNGNGNDRNAYEQGRQDEMRRQQQQREARAAEEHQRPPAGYGYPNNGYPNNGYQGNGYQGNGYPNGYRGY